MFTGRFTKISVKYYIEIEEQSKIKKLFRPFVRGIQQELRKLITSKFSWSDQYNSIFIIFRIIFITLHWIVVFSYLSINYSWTPPNSMTSIFVSISKQSLSGSCKCILVHFPSCMKRIKASWPWYHSLRHQCTAGLYINKKLLRVREISFLHDWIKSGWISSIFRNSLMIVAPIIQSSSSRRVLKIGVLKFSKTWSQSSGLPLSWFLRIADSSISKSEN